jgi:hypothetical protein
MDAVPTIKTDGQRVSLLFAVVRLLNERACVLEDIRAAYMHAYRMLLLIFFGVVLAERNQRRTTRFAPLT